MGQGCFIGISSVEWGGERSSREAGTATGALQISVLDASFLHDGRGHVE